MKKKMLRGIWRISQMIEFNFGRWNTIITLLLIFIVSEVIFRLFPILNELALSLFILVLAAIFIICRLISVFLCLSLIVLGKRLEKLF